MALEARLLAVLLSLLSAFPLPAGEVAMDTDPNSLLALVNRQHTLSREYVPPSLVVPDVLFPEGKDSQTLRPEAAEALTRMFREAAGQGVTLYAVSGYRTYAQQSITYRSKVEAVGERRAQLVVAPPGTSEHQLGLTMDVNGQTTLSLGLVEDFAASPEGVWVAENAHRFGFIIRYPRDKTEITGISWEPWHIRYVGEEAAEEIFSLDVTLEEYHAILLQRRLDAWAQAPEEEE